MVEPYRSAGSDGDAVAGKDFDAHLKVGGVVDFEERQTTGHDAGAFLHDAQHATADGRGDANEGIGIGPAGLATKEKGPSLFQFVARDLQGESGGTVFLGGGEFAIFGLIEFLLRDPSVTGEDALAIGLAPGQFKCGGGVFALGFGLVDLALGGAFAGYGLGAAAYIEDVAVGGFEHGEHRFFRDDAGTGFQGDASPFIGYRG